MNIAHNIWDSWGQKKSEGFFLFLSYHISTQLYAMLSIARETGILFNDEYLKYQQSITNVQQRLEKDIQLLGFDFQDKQDALEYINDRGKTICYNGLFLQT